MDVLALDFGVGDIFSKVYLGLPPGHKNPVVYLSEVSVHHLSTINKYFRVRLLGFMYEN